MDLSAAKDDSNSEIQAKVRLAKEKEMLQTEHYELKDKYKVSFHPQLSSKGSSASKGHMLL